MSRDNIIRSILSETVNMTPETDMSPIIDPGAVQGMPRDIL